MKLAISKYSSRLAAYKCFVAADYAGIELTPICSTKCGLILPSRSPTLINESEGLQLFGEHAICRFLGSMEDGDKKNRLKASVQSLAALDWVEFDERVSKLDGAHGRELLESRISQLQVVKGYLESDRFGVADICIGCTLWIARDSGVLLGPSSKSWLNEMLARHPEFSSILERSKAACDYIVYSHVENCFSQASSLYDILLESCQIAVDRAFPNLPKTVANISVFEGSKGKSKAKGDGAEFQFNSAMAVYKQLSGSDPTMKSPQNVASRLESFLKSKEDVYGPIVEKVQVAGPGFINLSLSPVFVAQRVKNIVKDGKLLPPHSRKCKVGVDFSSPNVAKEMHVGHLRSTVIGEVICRVFEFVGNDVKRINHIGDWGTQFGMLLTFLKKNYPDHLENDTTISDLDSFYKQAKKAFDASDEFKEESRLEVVRLQSGDPSALAGWKRFLAITGKALWSIYDRLGVTYPDGFCGESFYNSRIPDLVNDLEQRGIVTEEEGAKLIFTPACDVPLFLVKKDGGYGYDSTDLAALRYRIEELGLTKLIYVVDSGQSTHFQSCFEVVNRIGWTKNVDLHHVGFGVVLGSDRKRFRTRQGGTVRLVDLLDEARDRMQKDLLSRIADGRTNLSKDEIPHAAAVLGYSAVKYFDLKNSCEKDYIFDYDAMLASDGDTAVYLIYSYARICSIERKIEEELGLSVESIISNAADTFSLNRSTAQEWSLAISLLKFPETVNRTINELHPHILAAYTYGLASDFAKFYSACRLLVPAPDDPSRRVLDPVRGKDWLLLIHAVKICLRDSLELLSIGTLEKV